MLVRMAMIAIKQNLPKLDWVHRVIKEVAAKLQANGLILRESVNTNFIFIDYSKTQIENGTLDEMDKLCGLSVYPKRIAFHFSQKLMKIQEIPQNCYRNTWISFSLWVIKRKGGF